MAEKLQSRLLSFFLNIIICGALWGILEATLGYLIHLVSFPYSFVLLYPFACFFMFSVYRKTNRTSSIFFTGLICALVKLLDLFFPIRIDKVINPAISIVFEALSMALTVFALNRILKEKKKTPVIKALAALTINTGWRIFYILYLLCAPSFIRDISVISSKAKFTEFFILQNLIASALVFLLYMFKDMILKPLTAAEERITAISLRSKRSAPIIKTAFALMTLCTDIGLQFILR